MKATIILTFLILSFGAQAAATECPAIDPSGREVNNKISTEIVKGVNSSSKGVSQ